MAGRGRSITRRRFVELTGAGLGAAALAGRGVPGGARVRAQEEPTPVPIPDRQAAGGRKTTLQFFNSYGGPLFDAWVKMVEDYEATHPDVGIKVTFSPGHAENPKLLTSMAGGDPPDVAMMVDFQNAQYVELGVVTDLTPYVRDAALTQEDFWPAAWSLMNYQDKIWHLPFEIDPNFPFVWNKGLFEEAGLDPETPPQTIEEMEAFSQRITRIDNGKVTRIGIDPRMAYGYANAAHTWGWSFGGSFYDPERQEVTPDHDMVVKAVEWMTNYFKSIGGADKVAISPPNLQTHYFGTGNVGMDGLVAPQFRDIARYNPDLRMGTGLLPYAPPGASQPGEGAWISGWRLFIPQGSKNPDAAWDFIHWASATAEGSDSEWRHMGFLPGWMKAPVLTAIQDDPVMGVYYDALLAAKHVKDPIPVGAFFQGQLEEKTAEAIFGRMTPLEAMREVKELTMEEWERFKEQG